MGNQSCCQCQRRITTANEVKAEEDNPLFNNPNMNRVSHDNQEIDVNKLDANKNIPTEEENLGNENLSNENPLNGNQNNQLEYSGNSKDIELLKENYDFQSNKAEKNYEIKEPNPNQIEGDNSNIKSKEEENSEKMQNEENYIQINANEANNTELKDDGPKIKCFKTFSKIVVQASQASKIRDKYISKTQAPSENFSDYAENIENLRNENKNGPNSMKQGDIASNLANIKNEISKSYNNYSPLKNLNAFNMNSNMVLLPDLNLNANQGIAANMNLNQNIGFATQNINQGVINANNNQINSIDTNPNVLNMAAPLNYPFGFNQI